MSIHFKLITPERVVFEEEVDAVILPTKDGEITILENHIPLVSILSNGVVTLKKDNKEEYIASSGGFVEVLPESKVVMLSDSAERADELTLEAVESAKKRAEEALLEKRHVDDVGYAAAATALERELMKLKAITKRTHHEKTIHINNGE